jgi:energy-coupling factor transporter ATP-binding protein EcfA2
MTEPDEAAALRPPGDTPSRLAERLAALARLVQVASARGGPDGFPAALCADAERLLARAGERLQLSAEHTVVVLAGGTGSGKSSLFNALAGVDFSPVGVTRPITTAPHACVWEMEGAGPLLDWLGVSRRHRYARASALGAGEESLAGLVLLDLPDHDSVVGGNSGIVDRFVGLADLMIWVLDPQKYADAVVHRRYLEPLAGHGAVTGIILNQSDLLSAEEAEDCIGDLRRLLDSADFRDPRLLVASAKTGAGLDDVRKLLIDAVSERQAATDRIAADVDTLVSRFTTSGSDAIPPPAGIAADHIGQLVDAFAGAAGVTAVGEALRSAYELRAAGYVGWPLAGLARRIRGRDPVRAMQLGDLREELRAIVSGPVGAQQAEIDNTLTALAGDIASDLPQPWSRTIRDAIRSRAREIPGALGAAMKESLPTVNRLPGWWRLVRTWQWLLIAGVVAGFAWAGAILAFGAFHAGGLSPGPLLGDVTLLPWVGVMIVALLAAGALTSSACANMVEIGGEVQRERLTEFIRARIAGVVNDKVLVPAERELAEYSRFREALQTARR